MNVLNPNLQTTKQRYFRAQKPNQRMDEQMHTLLLIVGGIVGLVLIGGGLAALYFTPVQEGAVQGEQPMEESGPIMAGMLVQGAACEQDTDCVYALNAYPALRCVSPNCPDENDPNQPEQGDPSYEWIESYQETCLNAGAMSNQNTNGEELQIDSRAAACTCEVIGSPDGVPTSLTGQKICVTHLAE